MLGRPYAQIDCSLKDSQKFRSLSSAEARFAYLVIHLSDLSSYLGMFQYRKINWAFDANVEADRLEEIIAELTSVGLIEYDHDDEIVRVEKWFYKRSGPTNRDRIIGLTRDYERSNFANKRMLSHSVAEFAVAVLKRSAHWPKQQEASRAVLAKFLKEELINQGTVLLDAIIEEIDNGNHSLEMELISIIPDIVRRREHMVSTPCPHTRQNETDTTTKTKLKKTEISQFGSKVEAFNAKLVSVGDDQEMDHPKKRRGPLAETKNSKLAKGQ